MIVATSNVLDLLCPGFFSKIAPGAAPYRGHIRTCAASFQRAPSAGQHQSASRGPPLGPAVVQGHIMDRAWRFSAHRLAPVSSASAECLPARPHWRPFRPRAPGAAPYRGHIRECAAGRVLRALSLGRPSAHIPRAVVRTHRGARPRQR